ncbi:MAG: patatin-like phospholipase family protein [Campylobacterales bacterium]|nr:patatin-like phospholipase family protein [Campylobacterales bacterium]
MKKTTVSLILGSGGARGLTHIGIIRWLEENNYEIKSISGCSMGALVGGFYAAGKLDAYVEWLSSLNTLDMLKLVDLQGSSGLMKGEKLMKKLQELVGEQNIEELDIKFTAVATDINEEKEIWMNSGSLLKAIRASISLPMFFTPYRYKGRLLIDGGILNPVPIAPTFHDETDLTIAVNLGATEKGSLALKEKKRDEALLTKVKEYVVGMALPKASEESDNMYNIANKSFDSMQSTIARVKLAAYPPDIEVKVPRDLCGTLDFDKLEELIEYGYALCKESFEKEVLKREVL